MVTCQEPWDICFFLAGGNKEMISKPENTDFCYAQGGKCVPHECKAPQYLLGFCYDTLIFCCKTSENK